mgnify:CR=1 FL=1
MAGLEPEVEVLSPVAPGCRQGLDRSSFAREPRFAHHPLVPVRAADGVADPAVELLIGVGEKTDGGRAVEAGLVARRIVCFITEGESLGVGARFEEEAEADLAKHGGENIAVIERGPLYKLRVLIPPALLLFYVLASERLGFLPTAAVIPQGRELVKLHDDAGRADIAEHANLVLRRTVDRQMFDHLIAAIETTGEGRRRVADRFEAGAIVP